tara:strand:+ start:2532 stop:2915 length:384 start_codon:yes stop_codon:yes gene_type:complete
MEEEMTNKKSTEDHIKEVEQDDRIIQFDNGEEIASADVLRAIEKHERLHRQGKVKYNVASDLVINKRLMPDLDKESKRSDRFFGLRLGKSIDDIENTFLAMFAEFIVLMALFISMLGFGILLWAIFG